MTTTRGRPRDEDAHERILAAAYDLFRLHGTRSIGVDAVVERSGVSKMTLYRRFKSKERLVAAFLQRREQVWVMDWLKNEVLRHAQTPADQLLAAFDVYDTWFRSAIFDGCPYIRILVEYPAGHSTHRTACQHVANFRAFLTELARQAGIKDAKAFAEVWLIMLKGATVTACEGNRSAARQAKVAARLYLAAQLPKGEKKRAH